MGKVTKANAIAVPGRCMCERSSEGCLISWSAVQGVLQAARLAVNSVLMWSYWGGQFSR